MTKLIICRGISGSGKSTWARQQNGVVVERDEIRKMLFGTDGPDYYAVEKEVLSSREQTVTIVRDNMISGLLKSGKDVYVSDTNIEWKYVKALAKIGYRCGADVEVKVFDMDLGTAMMRDEFRGRNGGRWVGNEVIKKQYERFSKNKSMTLDSVDAVKPYYGTPGKRRTFLCDLDGTLADFKKTRGPFDTNVSKDEPIEVIIDIVEALWSAGLEVVFMSGRKEAARETTEEWLARHVTFSDWTLFMRSDGDNRPDNLVKADLFDEHVRENFDVKFVLDDRDQVVDMWRRMGLTCLQVAPGDF